MTTLSDAPNYPTGSSAPVPLPSDPFSLDDKDQSALLQELIEKGINPSTQPSESQIQRVRLMLQLLFHSSIVKPLRADPERAKLALAIIAKHSTSLPGLLHRLPPISEPQLPLYKWIIPRALEALARYMEFDPSPDLSDALMNTVVHIVTLLKKEDGAMGSLQATMIVRDIHLWAQNALADKADHLYGYKLSVTDANICAAHALTLRLSNPFTDGYMLDVAQILSSKAKALIAHPFLRQWFYRLVVQLLQIHRQPRLLDTVLYQICEMRDISSVLCAVNQADIETRFTVWQALLPLAGTFEHLNDDRVAHLLTPVPGLLSAQDILTAIPSTILEVWTRHSATSSTSYEYQLQALLGGVRPETRKRKRIEPTHRTICEQLGLPISDESLAKAVSRQIRTTSDPDAVALILVDVIDQLDEASATDAFELWKNAALAVNTRPPVWAAFDRLVQKYPLVATSCVASTSVWQTFRRSLLSRNRQERYFACRGLCKVARCNKPEYIRRNLIRQIYTMLKGSKARQGTAIALAGSLGKHVAGAFLCDVIELLVLQLGSPNSPLRSIACAELVDLADHHGKSLYALIHPFIDRISVAIVRNLRQRPDVFAEATGLLGQSRQNFLRTTLNYTLPALVIAQDELVIETIASIVGDKVDQILLDNMKDILTQVFTSVDKTDASLQFLVYLFVKGKDPNVIANITAPSLIGAVHIPLAVDLIVDLGDEDQRVRDTAVKALARAQQCVTGRKTGGFAEFLKPVMLGVMTHMNETLHDMHGKKSPLTKRKLIRSLAALFERVGIFMASYSPQIMATLQSTLADSDLRPEALVTLRSFVHTLKHSDFGPFAGRTIGALVAIWEHLSPPDMLVAIDIINEIADNASHLSSYIDDIVGLDDIPELCDASVKLKRPQTDPSARLRLILDRASSQNSAIATTSMRELAKFLRQETHLVSQLTVGDTFDPIVPDLVRTLLTAISKEGNDALCLNACECLGIIGALDPDRFNDLADPPPMTIANNFTDDDESTDFAIHLVRDVLVHAFRGTYDTKYQSHLAFGIQSLLAFCQFTPQLLNSNSNVALKIRHRWQSLPKDQIEVLAPLLESRYAMGDVTYRKAEYPIYPTASGYREWVQSWSIDLIGRLMSGDSKGTVQRLFGSLRGVLRQPDVTVACHILPHLVLHTLLSGEREARHDTYTEINAVLQDQVNPKGSANKRTLSAQMVFDLMDHLSRYLRVQRGSNRPERATSHVDKLVASLETELMANAALQSKAFARSLRNFEQRITYLRDSESRSNGELQTYFERLHQIYADLDEPDGMEGVSTLVVAPSLEHQIREHESTGRWTHAQSCWEVRLQQSPDDVSLHVGLLKCLQNLGHYDTLRTHIRGVLNRHPEWYNDLSSFTAESAWITGDWAKVEALGSVAKPFGPVMLALQRRENMPEVFAQARQQIGSSIVSRQYARAYEGVLKLHQLHDIELIHATAVVIRTAQDTINTAVVNVKTAENLMRALDVRYSTTAPSFRMRESILTVRRAALGLVNVRQLDGEVGQAWIQSSRIARKAGYEQTAYTSALQASERDTPFAFVQHAKLLRWHDGAFKALSLLENALNLRNEAPQEQRRLAKALLLDARWAQETDRFEHNEVIARFHKATELGHNLESPHFHLGHYHDGIASSASPEEAAIHNYQTCHYYILALRYGVKYIYQTMPRMLTLWLDLGEIKDTRDPPIARELQRITVAIDRARKELPTWQFFTAFPQIVSRIGHPHEKVQVVLRKIMAKAIERYPQQAMWPTIGVMQSKRTDRKSACEWVLNRAQGNNPHVANMIREGKRLSAALLRLAEDKVDKREVSIVTLFPYVKHAVPSKMIMPLQDALTCVLPTNPDRLQVHNPFPQSMIEIQDIQDRIEVMPSLQKPKKLVFMGTDGKKYPFLCKPHDDLRKDARLMDFNSMINKLLKSASESRRRHLYIRTYAVMPLNEECGLLEWVGNTNAFKRILEKEYARAGKKIYSSQIHNMLENSRKKGAEAQIKTFKDSIIPMFSPTVFQNWFLHTWPEPSAWLASRMAYSRTLAVMSMIGYVLGLGDRHGENILFDGMTGDTVHVDLNCLFEKGKTFEIPERVPFRLTHNMVDALGVAGVEGVFRKAAEIAMGILRANSDSLMSVLEAFAHDPLVEWAARGGRAKSDKDIRSSADRNLRPIRVKLRGENNGMVSSVPRQVDILIKEATSANNLAIMYQGWAPYL